MGPPPTNAGSSRSALVLGAGAVGLACAWFLRRAGRRVTVVDRGQPGHGATWGTAGLLCPAHSQPLPGRAVLGKALRWIRRADSPFHIRLRADRDLAAWLARFVFTSLRGRSEAAFEALLGLSSLSLDLFEKLRREGTDDFFFERRGDLLVFLSESGLAAGRAGARRLRRAGLPAEVLDGDAVREREPSLGPAVRGGVLFAGDAHAFSPGFAKSLARALRGLGVRIETGLSAASLIHDCGTVRGAVFGTGDGSEAERTADETVVALGAGSPKLARTAGVRLPIQPAKGYSATVRTFPGAPRIPVMVAERKVIVTPFGDRVRFAGTLELAGFEPGVNPVRYRAVIEGAREVLRGPVPLDEEVPWAGFRPLTPSSVPFIGRPAGTEGLLVAAGHGTLGFTQSLGTGLLVQEIADGLRPSLDPAPFAPPAARLRGPLSGRRR